MSQKSWQSAELRRIPLVYRNDGFSQFFVKPPMTRERLEKELVNPFQGTNVQILEWGLGPGSVFCYDTKVGQVFGAGLTDEQWKLFRPGDRWVFENVTGLIKAGADPLRAAVQRGHQIGLKVFARLEMNHEYGPADDKNWMWVGFVGDLNKKHPEYRIPGGVNLDFKHKEVRDFKLAIFREAAEAGVDGISMDFVVYPPFFEKPDKEIMTQFIRDTRRMLDDVGPPQNRRLELMVRVPYREALEPGLDWPTWMNERLVDIVVPSHRGSGQTFDIVGDDFVSLGRRTGCKVYACIWHSLGFVDTDSQPGDEKTGVRRYDKPKTKEMFYAQALLFNRAGADGIQLAMSAAEWNSKPWMNDLADPAKLEYADKHYMVDPHPHMPVSLTDTANSREVPLRIADDIPRAQRERRDVEVSVLFYSRPLQKAETLALYVNGHGPATISGDAPDESAKQAPIDRSKVLDKSFLFNADWWKRGEHKVPVDPAWWRCGINTIRLVYSAQSSKASAPFSVRWIDVLIKYRNAAGQPH